MPSTYSPSLRIELIGDGEQDGIWGQTTNNNLGDLIEQAIAGVTTIDVTSADVTLTSYNGVVDEARSAVIAVTGTPAVTRNVIIPNEPKCYTVLNNTGVVVTIKTTSGTGYACSANSQSTVQCDGSGTGTVTGMTISTVANALTASSDLAATAASVGLAKLNSPAFTGTPTAPTAAQGTDSTQIATTAFVQAEIAADTTQFAPINSPTFTGIPAAPTAAVGTNTTQLATTAFVNAEIANDAPTKTGTGATGTWGISISGNAATSTTQVPGTNNTTIATTAFTTAAVTAVTTNGTLTTPTISNALITGIRETITVSATAATGTINFDTLTQAVLYYTTNASGNWTLNVRGNSGTTLNSVMATGQSLSITFMATQGGTAYYNNVLTIDGSAVTPKWQGGTAPTSGNTSGIDVYTYAIVKTASATFTVFASQTKFA